MIFNHWFIVVVDVFFPRLLIPKTSLLLTLDTSFSAIPLWQNRKEEKKKKLASFAFDTGITFVSFWLKKNKHTCASNLIIDLEIDVTNELHIDIYRRTIMSVTRFDAKNNTCKQMHVDSVSEKCLANRQLTAIISINKRFKDSIAVTSTAITIIYAHENVPYKNHYCEYDSLDVRISRPIIKLFISFLSFCRWCLHLTRHVLCATRIMNFFACVIETNENSSQNEHFSVFCLCSVCACVCDIGLSGVFVHVRSKIIMKIVSIFEIIIILCIRRRMIAEWRRRKNR